jgi:N-acetylglucosamine-6-phosphate deacetylase
VFSGSPVQAVFGRAIDSVTAAAAPAPLYLSPGFVDIQVNGFAGVDYNSPLTPHDEIARSIHTIYSTGVTRFYPTVITGAPHDMLGALRNLAKAKEELPEGRAMDGFHVEGPHISAEDGPRGAHPKHCVRKPDLEEFLRWQEAARGEIRLVTVAPEWPAITRYIESVTAQGVTVSIGHTNAEAHEIAAAVSAGATLSTHLGNGAHAVLRRHPNYIWEQLAEDRLWASFIADGIHLPACFLKSAIRAKTVERAVLVTDASSPAGAAPGRYRLGEQEVDLTPDNRVVLAGQDKLAGSALRMDDGVANLVALGGVSLADAVRMATVNPARVGQVPARTKGLAEGERADFVLFDFDGRVHVRETWIDGEKVFG